MLGAEVHPQNHLLPPRERAATVQEGGRLRSEVDALLQRLLHDNVAEQAAVGRVCRMVESYVKLGYVVQNSQRSEWMTALQTLALTKRATTSSQEKLLRAAAALAKKAAPTTFKPDYQRLWHLLVSLCEENELTHASTPLYKKLLNAVTHFLRSTRHCLDDDDAKKIIDAAMTDLRRKDTTDMHRGLLMLFVLMPTYHSHYDAYLPEWVSTWLSLDANAQWDAMWLTILHRASKNNLNFDWATLIPPVATKCRRQLPVLAPDAVRPAAETMGTYARPHLGSHPWQPDVSIIKAYAKMLVFLCEHGEVLEGRGPEPLAFEFVAGLADLGPLPFPTHTFAALSAGSTALIGILRSIRTAFHPSNMTGDFSSCYDLMKCICEQLLKWRALEVSGTSPHRRLDQKTYDVLAVEMIAYVQESTYSRNMRGMAFGLVAVQAIAVLSPVLASTVLVPFFARALQPSAVNNPHQAPAALQGLAMLAQPLLHPRPLLLQYLPDLLQQSLPGLDPNDTRKSASTLSFYTAVLSWLPARADMQEEYDPNWQAAPLPFSVGEGIYDPGQDAYERAFGIPAVLAEWSVEVAKRLCTVFTTQEAAGPKGQPSMGTHIQHVMNTIVENFTTVFFSAMDAATHDKVMNVMLDFFTSHIVDLANAKTLVNFCVEAMAFAQPQKVADICRKLITGVINFDGTILASSTKTAFHLNMLANAVRLAGPQLVVIRSELEVVLTEAFYRHEDKDVRKAACAVLSSVLHALTATYPFELRSAPPSAWSSGQHLWKDYGKPVELETMDVQWHLPSAEELAFAVDIFSNVVVGSMGQVRTLLSGDAASLSHDLGAKLKPLLSAIKHGMIGAAELLPLSYSGEGDDHTLTTSMSLLSLLQPAQREVLCGFRHRLAKFLHEVFVQISSSHQLQNNVKLLQGWSRLVEVVICTRTRNAAPRNPPEPDHNVFTSALRGIVEKSWYQEQASGSDRVAFWNIHVTSRIRQIMNAWAIRCMRANELSFASARGLREMTTPDGEPLIDAFKTLLLDLHRLCCFDFVAVRNKAQQRFDSISPRFGFLMDDFVTATLDNVNEESSTSHITWGSLSLLGQARIMRRITGQWRHLARFISVVLDAHSKISALAKVENENQDMMNNTISSLFVKYIDQWQHIPVVTQEHQATAEQAWASLLSRFAVARGAANPEVATTLPFRFELFAAWLIMHFVGHPDLTPPPEVWHWATALVRQAHDQPIQHIVLGTLARLLISTKANLSDAEHPLLLSYTVEQADAIRAACLQPSVVQGCFRAAVLSHQSGDRKAQWAAGVDRMIHQASCHAGVRTFFRTAGPVSSNTFKIRNALLVSLWTRVAGLDAVPLWLDAIATPPREQTDVEDVNRTRAEVFTGLCLQLCRLPGQSQPLAAQQLGGVFEANTRSLSMEFSQPWATAIRTIFAYGSAEEQQAWGHMLLTNVANVLKSTSEANDTASDEGFAAQARHILFAHAAVHEADVWDERRTLASQLRQLVIPGGLAIRYKVVRDEVASLIAELCHAFASSGLVEMTQELQKAVADVPSGGVADGSEDGVAVGETSMQLEEQSSSPARAQHVAMRQMAAAVLATISKGCKLRDYDTLAPELVRIVTLSLLWANSELNRECKSAVRIFSYHLNLSARADGRDGISQLLTICAELTKSDAWQIRSTALGVLGVVYALNQFSLAGPEKNEILQRVLQALTDPKEEIAEQARTLLIAFVHSMPPSYLKEWIEARIRIARQYVGRRDQGAAPSAEYLTSVQILCSVIRAFPYDMPTFMPSVLSAVVRHSSAPAPIGKIVSKTIQDFKRTHQDRWEDVKLFFTAEQLEDLNDAAPTQNYFV